MWWNQPRLRDFPPLLPDNILDVAARAYTVTEVGGLSGYGPERGRNFEKLFYGICDRRGVHLTERAGSRSLAGQRSASGFNHEVDAATRSLESITHWELKHLTSELDKNELLVFNGKGLDFLYGSSALYAKVPLRRFLLSGAQVGEECRNYAALWGIMLIEPGRLPLPLMYEAVARGEICCLSFQDREACGSWSSGSPARETRSDAGLPPVSTPAASPPSRRRLGPTSWTSWPSDIRIGSTRSPTTPGTKLEAGDHGTLATESMTRAHSSDPVLRVGMLNSGQRAAIFCCHLVGRRVNDEVIFGDTTIE
jgi:hypothetical protein